MLDVERTPKQKRQNKTKKVRNFGNTDFRLWLQQELIRRCEKNPSYSLRAFAKSLGVHAPTLSHLLRGSRPISSRMMSRLGNSLNLGPAELARFGTSGSSAPFAALQEDAFNVISDWYHFALLDLIRVKGFRQDPKWVARALGITVSEVNVAVERSERVGLLEIEDGVWKPSNSGNTIAQHEFTTVAMRRLQKKFLGKASEAVDSIPFERRDHSGLTVAARLADLPEIQARIRRFRSELCEFIEREPVPADEVYQLTVAFFPLSRSRPGESHGNGQEK